MQTRETTEADPWRWDCKTSGSDLLMRPTRQAKAAGFTLVEMMIVLIILAVLSVIATPLFYSDRAGEKSKTFASGVARELQRARMMAISSRLPVNVYVFRDRIELRTFVLPLLPNGTPNPLALPVAPNLADPPLSVIAAENDIDIWAVTTANTPQPGAIVLPTAGTPASFRINTRGGLDNGVNAGAGTAVTDLAQQVLWIQHAGLGNQASAKRYRIEVTGLTGFVRLFDSWTP